MRWSSRRAPAWPTGWAGLVDRCGRRYGLTAVDDIARQLAGSALIRVHHVLRGRGERHTLFGLPAKRDTRRLRRAAGGGRPARCRDASPHRHILPGILAPCVQRGRSAAAAPRRGARLAIHRCGWVAGQGAPVRLTRPATAPARPGQQRPILSSLPDHRRRAAIAVATMLLNSSPLMKRRGGLSAIWRETALHWRAASRVRETTRRSFWTKGRRSGTVAPSSLRRGNLCLPPAYQLAAYRGRPSLEARHRLAAPAGGKKRSRSCCFALPPALPPTLPVYSPQTLRTLLLRPLDCSSSSVTQRAPGDAAAAAASASAWSPCARRGVAPP